MNRQQAEIAHLLRQGAKMVRELAALKRFEARFAERLEQDYNEALASVLVSGDDLAECHRIAAYPLKHLGVTYDAR